MCHHHGVARKSPHMVAEHGCGSAELSIEGRVAERICEQIGTVQEQTYSLLQQSSFVGPELSTHLARSEVSTMIRRLATQEHYVVLAQLVSLISAILKFGAGTCENPFMRVNTLITELISWLQEGLRLRPDRKRALVRRRRRPLQRRILKLTLRSTHPYLKQPSVDGEVSSQDRISQCTVEQTLDVPVLEMV